MQYKMGQSKTANKIAYLGMFASLAILFGYIETLIPFHFGIPGMKLGLANIMTVIVLYYLGVWEAVSVSIVRILMVGFLFGSPYSIVYSLAGGVISLFLMVAVKQIKSLSIIGVSIIGGVMHNIGQLIVAMIVVEELGLSYYTPLLIISGTITGLLIGIVSKLVFDRITKSGVMK